MRYECKLTSECPGQQVRIATVARIEGHGESRCRSLAVEEGGTLGQSRRLESVSYDEAVKEVSQRST